MALTTPPVHSEPSSPRNLLLILFAVALITTPVFWFTDLDLIAARQFYHPETPDNLWPDGNAWLWQFFYHGVPVLAATIVLGALFVLLYSSLRGRLQQYKLAAGCVLLTILLGPGLLVNAIFKDNWCRPRPNQVMEFNGDMHYIPPLMIGDSRKGESFPAGHPSIGFSLAIFWLLLRRRKPRLALAALATAIIAGTLMGVGRMAAGGHFLSDVLWSGYMTFFAAIMVYYYILRVPQRRAAALNNKAQQTVKTPSWQIGLYIAVGISVLTGALFGFPVDKNQHYKIDSTQLPVPPRIVTLTIDRGDVEIRLTGKTDSFFDLHTTIRGFGLPTNKVETSVEQGIKPVAHINYQLTHVGIYSELNSIINLQLPASDLEQVVVHLQKGDITVEAQSGLAHLPQLELTTGDGKVTAPAR